MSTYMYCQTNVSLIKDHVPVRIIGIITVRQAFKTMMKIFTNTMGKLRVTAVLEIRPALKVSVVGFLTV